MQSNFHGRIRILEEAGIDFLSSPTRPKTHQPIALQDQHDRLQLNYRKIRLRLILTITHRVRASQYGKNRVCPPLQPGCLLRYCQGHKDAGK